MVAHFDTLDEQAQRAYKAGLEGAFARVAYRFAGASRGYVVGLIDDLVVTSETYKVEQRETKTQIKLRNGEKIKQFKLTLVSDAIVTEVEFKKCLRENRQEEIDKAHLDKVKKKLEDCRRFQYDKQKMAKQIAKQTMDKIMAGNFKGLNLSDCKLTLLGQISLAQ